ncbi:hypothetical protein D9M70_590310 [compost metagenome]
MAWEVAVHIRTSHVRRPIKGIGVLERQVNKERITERRFNAPSVCGKTSRTVENRIANRCERQLVELFAIDRLTKILPRQPSQLSEFVSGIDAPLG